MYKIKIKEQELLGSKVIREKTNYIKNFEDYNEALDTLNCIFFRVSKLLMDKEKDCTLKTDNIVTFVSRGTNGELKIRFINKKSENIKRCYKIVKQR